LWGDLMSFVSNLNSSVTDDFSLVTPEIHSLLSRLVHADIDRINFTSFDVLVSNDEELLCGPVCDTLTF